MNKLKIRRILFLASITALTVFLCMPAQAYRGNRGQGGPGGGPMGKGPGQDPKIMEKMDTIRLVKLVEILDLDEEKALKLSGVFKKHREKSRQMRDKIAQISKDVQENISKSLNDKNVELGPNAKKITALVEAYQVMMKNLQDEKGNFTDEVLKMLDPLQKGKFIMFQQTFPKQLRKNMRDFRDKRMNSNKQRFNNPGVDQNGN